MLRHIEDKGPVAILVNDAGEILFVCSECGKTWVGSTEPVSEASGARRDRILTGLEDASSLLRSLDIDPGSLR